MQFGSKPKTGPDGQSEVVMARLSGERVTKREAYMRGWMEKQVTGEKKITLDTANTALVAHFGKDEPKMRAERVYEIRDEVLNGKTSTKAVKTNAVKTGPAPVTAKRGPGRPKGSTNKAKEAAGDGEVMCLRGDVKHLLQLAGAAGLTVTVDTRATEAISALRA